MTVDARQMMADAKFYESYSRWLPKKGRKETWEEAVDRVMNMHREYYADKMCPDLEELISFAETHYKKKHILGAQRALQFGGKQLLDHPTRMYNCSVTHIDRPEVFSEIMYNLLCGSGVGFSVQRRHIDGLPPIISKVPGASVRFAIPDSIEGWADACSVLMNSYFPNNEWSGKLVAFDFGLIRPKGAEISGGFKAPGPEPLKRALWKVDEILSNAIGEGQTRLRPIQVYDIVMHMADAVIAGGVRRSATICMFDFDDDEMMNAKTGDWFVTNPQRGRSNNSAMILRNEITWDQFSKLMKSVEHSGEPGFIFTDNLDFCFNPCVEIGMLPKTPDGRSGFEYCNLTEINGAFCDSRENLLDACKAASIMGTLQAGYTSFKYMQPVTREIVEREALIGVSITGWMNNPEVLFDESNMREGASTVKHWNKVVAELIGINQAARTTCVKPSGNASVLLGTASGIHGEHSPRYLRHVQLNKETEVSKALLNSNPAMCEESVWSANGTDIVVAFPVVSPETSVYKKDLYGVKQLEYVKKAQQVWIECGTNEHLSTVKELRHNVSNTISVDNWDEVARYVFDNREWFAGISFLSSSGDKDYAQAPFTEVFTEQQIVDTYGPAALFASGLIVAGVEAFNHFWGACDTAIGQGEKLGSPVKALPLKKWQDWLSKIGFVFQDKYEIDEVMHKKVDFVRRAQKFANTYFDGDMKKMTYCLKDVYNLHRWQSITRNLKRVEWEGLHASDVDVDTLGAQGCSGGSCELNF